MSSLSHHGVKGQKWGVRRYQNYDGTRTALAKRRDFERTASKVVEDSSNSPQPFVRRPFNKDKIRQRGLITQAEADQCAGLAAGVFKQASQVEPQITGDVIDVVSSTSAKMYGLNNRLKQPTSIAAKIGADAKEDGVTFEQAAGGLKDVIRYTAVSDSRDYVSTYKAIKQRLEEKGYTETKCKNYFQKYQNGEVMHKAVQSTFRSPDGVEFEFQFQTPESQAAKELKVPIYNERRKAGNTPERNAELEQEMRNLAEQVPDPEGVFGIESHSGAKNMKHSSLGGTMYDRQLEHSSMAGDGMLVVDGTLYLEHHGVKGQKHGVRQYQNYDGSLTPLGRIHYGYGQARSKAEPIVTNALKKTGQAAGIVTNAFKEARRAAAAASEERRERKQAKLKEKASKDRSSVLKNRNLFTTKELEDLEKRFTAEDKLRANIPDKKALRKAAADQKEAEKLAERKEKASQTREGVLRNKKLFTNEELKALSERFNTEDKIKQESIDKGLAVVKNMANAAQSVQTIVSVFEDVSGYNISPIKRAQAEQKKAWDLEDRQRKQHFEDTKEAREESKYKREEASAAAKDKRDIETWERDKQRADAKEQREIEQVEYNRKRDRAKDQRERAERLIKRRQDTEDRKRRLAREDAEDRRKAAEEIRKIKKEAAEERRKAITGKNLAKKQKAEARLAEIKAIEAAMGLSNNKDLTDFEEWLRTIDPTWTRHDSFDSDYVIQNGVLLVNPQGSSLAHHGVEGQKWGVRRYQNYDGSLTAAGRERYGVGPESRYNASINEDAIRASGHKYYAKKHPKNKIGYNDNPKDSEDAADKRRAEIAKELRKMGFKISENMTAEEHEAATAKILEKPYTEKKPLTAEDFRQIPDRFKVEAMTDKEKKELAKADFDGDKYTRMKVPSDYRQQPGYNTKDKAQDSHDDVDELEQLEADRLKRNQEREEKLKKAKESGEYDSDFEEAVMYNTYYSWGGTGGIDAKNKAYKNYLNNPQKFMDKANKKERREIDRNRRTAEKYKRQSTEWQTKADRLRSSGNLEEARRLEAKATEVRFWSEELTGITDYREEKLQRRMNHSSMESNYIIQNGVLMINPAERR